MIYKKLPELGKVMPITLGENGEIIGGKPLTKSEPVYKTVTDNSTNENQDNFSSTTQIEKNRETIERYIDDLRNLSKQIKSLKDENAIQKIKDQAGEIIGKAQLCSECTEGGLISELSTAIELFNSINAFQPTSEEPWQTFIGELDSQDTYTHDLSDDTLELLQNSKEEDKNGEIIYKIKVDKNTDFEKILKELYGIEKEDYSKEPAKFLIEELLKLNGLSNIEELLELNKLEDLENIEIILPDHEGYITERIQLQSLENEKATLVNLKQQTEQAKKNNNYDVIINNTNALQTIKNNLAAILGENEVQDKQIKAKLDEINEIISEIEDIIAQSQGGINNDQRLKEKNATQKELQNYQDKISSYLKEANKCTWKNYEQVLNKLLPDARKQYEWAQQYLENSPYEADFKNMVEQMKNDVNLINQIGEDLKKEADMQWFSTQETIINNACSFIRNTYAMSNLNLAKKAMIKAEEARSAADELKKYAEQSNNNALKEKVHQLIEEAEGAFNLAELIRFKAENNNKPHNLLRGNSVNL